MPTSSSAARPRAEIAMLMDRPRSAPWTRGSGRRSYTVTGTPRRPSSTASRQPARPAPMIATRWPPSPAIGEGFLSRGLLGLRADLPQVGEGGGEQGAAQVVGARRPARPDLRADRPLDHLQVPVPPFLDALVQVDERLADLGCGPGLVGVDVEERLLHAGVGLPRGGGVTFQGGARDVVALAVQVPQQRVEQRRARHRGAEPLVVAQVRGGERAPPEDGLDLAELLALEAAGGPEDAPDRKS